jgi:hypothetical protein
METGLGSEVTLAPRECPAVTVKYRWSHPSMALNASGIILMKIGNVFAVKDNFFSYDRNTQDDRSEDPVTFDDPTQTYNQLTTYIGKKEKKSFWDAEPFLK